MAVNGKGSEGRKMKSFLNSFRLSCTRTFYVNKIVILEGRWILPKFIECWKEGRGWKKIFFGGAQVFVTKDELGINFSRVDTQN